MTPARTSNRRAQRDQNTNHIVHHDPQQQTLELGVDTPKTDLFLDPMMGTPLPLYVEKDVENREHIVDLITKNGGIVSPGYSGVQYILVDPHKESGQNLYRQYAGKKGKLVLNANWVIECVKAGLLQTYHTNFANCKVTGTERVITANENNPQPDPTAGSLAAVLPSELAQAIPPGTLLQPTPTHPHLTTAPIQAAAEALVHHQQATFGYNVYSHPASAGPPQSWQAASGIVPQQTHMTPPHMMDRHPGFRTDQAWATSYHQQAQASTSMVTHAEFDYRYREEQPNWVATATEYYNQTYEQTYGEPETTYMEEAGPSNQQQAPDAPPIIEASEPPRGRKRNRTQPQPAPPASTLVINRRNPPARSPTPPTRVIKSTYGGNLFTSDDIMYLKKYIDYCREQGLVLSLREICERIAVKAPHHTFYSWRRYCNKHQIRLGGYAMDIDGGSPVDDDPVESHDQVQLPIPSAQPSSAGVGPNMIAAARQAVAGDGQRNRSPTPPRALFRSTTGKGVAFTEEDVMFLMRFLEYRTRIQGGKVDMVAFWKDVAAKAPHHSRASWMKFYRRHKHELHHADGDDPLPAPPEKKMRYSRADDVLLAKHFINKPEGTSDKVFQAFARIHPHHPWKGWQEHHRIHKAKIDHLISQLSNGEHIDSDSD
ncbi:hypothetical protein C8Q75DRAFT_797370 [Abortiporus biennis]|nr:hypothetical protein C8Q75DRAFT_797370 [Abortiporus biennis]